MANLPIYAINFSRTDDEQQQNCETANKDYNKATTTTTITTAQMKTHF